MQIVQLFTNSEKMCAKAFDLKLRRLIQGDPSATSPGLHSHVKMSIILFMYQAQFVS